MQCYTPLDAVKTVSGGVSFDVRQDGVSIKLPCGQCIGCRLRRSYEWAVRAQHEASMHPLNCVITLTYATEHLPYRSSLDYSHFQKFMKRFRKKLGPQVPVQYMCAGEYGELDWRPHFHACIFGVDFLDKTQWKRTKAGSLIYRSTLLEKLWPMGHSSVGELNFQSAAYVARYNMKKQTGFRAKAHYMRVDQETGECYWLTPEFFHPSLKRPIGKSWLQKYHSEVYPHDRVISQGKEVRVPRSYDRWYKEINPDMLREVSLDREETAFKYVSDNTAARLDDKRKVAASRLKHFKRDLSNE